MTKQQQFFELLNYSNELKQKKNSLYQTDREAFNLLLHFSVIIETNLHYFEKQEYIELIKNFLSNQVTTEDFSYAFLAIYEGINKKMAEMKRNESLELGNFLTVNRDELGNLLARVYGSCDSYSPDPEISMCDEKELKNEAQILLLELQK